MTHRKQKAAHKQRGERTDERKIYANKIFRSHTGIDGRDASSSRAVLGLIAKMMKRRGDRVIGGCVCEFLMTREERDDCGVTVP